MNQNPKSYWEVFLNRFISEITNTPTEKLKRVWNTVDERTKFYAHELLPGIASGLGLSFKKEFHTVDYIMSTKEHNVPIIFIESENNAITANQEMAKLCSVSAPLSILITVIEWNPQVYGDKAKGNKLINDWEHIIKAYNETWPRTGLLGIIVGECGPDNVLRFYKILYAKDGEKIEGEEKIIEIQLSV